MPPLQIIRIRRNTGCRAPKGAFSLQVVTNQEAFVEAQIKARSGRLLSTLTRVPVASADSFSFHNKHQEVQLEGQLKDTDGRPLLPGTYIVEVTATVTSPDQRKVTRHLPITLVN